MKEPAIYVPALVNRPGLIRAMANKSVTLTRDNTTKPVTLQQREDKRDIVNRLLNEKYTWGDDWVSLFFDRDASIAVEIIHN